MIKEISPIDKKVTQFIHELDKYQESLYPPESNHLDSTDELLKDNVTLVGAFLGEQLAGIGAIKKFVDYGELKRVYIPQVFRRKGLAKKIVSHLESIQISEGFLYSRLETGIRQEEAILFYKSIGYIETKPFGSYLLDPLSVFMEKDLNKNAE